MKLKIDNNTLIVNIDEPTIDYGAPFKESPVMPDTSSLSDSTLFNKINVNKLSIRISYEVFKEIVRVWEVRFNMFLPFQQKKIIEDALNLSSVVENIRGENYNEIKAVEIELKEHYEENSKSTIIIEANNIHLYNTDYIWYIRPTSISSFESYFIPKKIFEKIDDEELNKDFFLAIKIPLSLIQDNLSSDRESANETITLGETNIPFTYKEMPEKVEEVFIKLTKFLSANQSMVPKIFEMYYGLCKFAISKIEAQMKQEHPNYNFVKTFISRVYGSQNLFKMVGIRGMKVNNERLSWWVAQRTYYIYADILFPLYLHTEKEGLITYYSVLDDDERSCYGPFSKAAIGLTLNKDEPIDDNFNSFFIYDFINKDNLPPITKTILPYPDFEENTQ